jgi:membrane protein DedA with SNARE-associated domain
MYNNLPLLQHFSVISQNYGVFGLGIGMFFESLGIPFASAVVALTAGTLIAAGKTSFWEALLISTTGLTLGSLVSYYIGYWGSKMGRYLSGDACTGEKKNFFQNYQRWGEITVLIAQLFGTTRTWISLPAGAMKMRLRKFLTYTAIGGAIYCALAIGFSMVLAKMLSRLLNMIASTTYLGMLVLSLVVIAVATTVYIFRQKKGCSPQKAE